MYRVVVKLDQQGYVSESGIVYDGYVNVTDDSVINHTGPNAINAPIAGAGALTVIEGTLKLESPPFDAVQNVGILDDSPPEIWLSFTSSVNGFTNLSSPLNSDGSWSIELELDPLETKTNVSATLGFSGWQDTQVVGLTPVQFHLRPTTTAILMDVHTGEVLSLASLPDFDPNNRPSLPAQLKAADSPLFNRALQGVYELGSTFKIFAVSQALQMGMVTPETVIDIRGPIRWGKFRIKDYHNYGSKLPVFEVITKSSNIGAARIAQMIGAEEQKRFLASLGFLAPIQIEMPEASGGRPLLPSKWTELSTMTISYGHGLSATPLHLAVGYAAIANGGYKVSPTLVPNPRVEKGERVMSQTVSKQAVEMLRSVVTDGTASFGEVAGYAVAGKTGTADKPNPQGAYHEEKVISTFASIFPANDPKYVLVVSLDEPEDRTGSEPRRTAGWTAVPVAAEIIGRIAPLLGMRPLIEKQTRADITLTSTN